MEIKVWRLPVASVERPHGLKYSFFYGRDGQRLVGFDDERGKGDHRHILDREEKYEFISIDRLMADFFEAIEKIGGLK